MTWAAAYVLLLALLFVRVRTADGPVSVPDRPRPVPGEPVWLVRVHHRLFYLLLLAAVPLEAAIRGGRPTGRALGAVLLTLGVLGYRLAASVLGEALSPLIEPLPGAGLVTRGLYRYVRHPMYLGQALIAVGAPLVLGCRWSLWLAGAAVAVLLARVAAEEHALARSFPQYPRYASRTKRIVPFIF